MRGGFGDWEQKARPDPIARRSSAECDFSELQSHEPMLLDDILEALTDE